MCKTTKRDRALRAGLIATVAAGVGLGAWAQTDFDAVEIVVHPVAANVYMLEGRGGNLGVSVGADGVCLIDDQYAPLTDKIVAAIGTISDGDIRFLINTHIHPDHVGGNENIGRMGATIIGHDNIRRRLMAGVFGNPPAPAIALPAITFTDGISLHLNGDHIRATKVAASHTDGDTIVHFVGADVIHTGDVFRTTAFPVIDIRHGGTYSGTLAALDAIIAAAGPETRIIPGHGVVTDRAMVQTFRDMVATIGGRVEALIDEGRSLDEVLAARVTAEYDQRWAPPAGFFFTTDDLLTVIYNELSVGP